MDARGSCHVRLESGGTGEVQSPGRPSPVPHPSRRGGAPAPIPPSHHGHDLEHWPLRDTLILGALPDAVPSARAHLRQLLTGWGRAALSPDASVVVSELVTNSVAASAELQTGCSARAGMARIRLALPSPCRGRREPPASGSAEPGAGHRRGPRAGAGGSAQQPVGLAPGQHHRADESYLGGMAPAIWGWSAVSYRRAVKPSMPSCRGVDHAGTTRA